MAFFTATCNPESGAGQRPYSPRALRFQHGFTYLALLFMVATVGAGLAVAGVDWHTMQQREKEAELLFIGQEFRKAIALYYYRTPGGAYEYPKSLEELLEDHRFPSVQRYLRRIYRDPLTNQAQWGLIQSGDGRISGVRSLSEGQPLKTDNFPAALPFEGKRRYSEWEFVFVPPSGPPTALPAPVQPHR